MIEIKLNFSTLAEAAAALATLGGVTFLAATAPAETAKPGKSAKTAPPAASSPSAAPAPTPAAPETPPPAGPAELPYAPIGQRIAEMVAVSNPASAANRAGIKAVFAALAERYGTPVKTGQDVRAADRPALVEVLDGLSTAESMS